MPKPANTDHPVHELIAARWSPYSFQDKSVSESDLRSLFEAARWAPSGFNEQPWRYIVARREDAGLFAKLLECLVEPNRVWARNASVLALGITQTALSRNGKPNRTAHHDLGLASAAICFEAAARGLVVHQMGGILPDRAREIFTIPEDADVHTALAIGYEGAPDALEGPLAGRDDHPRSRRSLGEFVFGEDWDTPAGFLK